MFAAAVRSSGSSVEGTHDNAEERIYHSDRVQIHSYINESPFAQEEAGKMGEYKNSLCQTLLFGG